MLHFITRYSRGTIQAFMDSWAPELRSEINVLHYRSLPFTGIPAGTLIFADLEKVRFWELAFGKRLRMRAAGKARMLNDPCAYIGKFELLKELHRAGINNSIAYRPSEVEAAANIRFPVFLKRDSDHKGAVGGLINSRAELEVALNTLSLGDRLHKERLMILEYCDCADHEGVFRKYSAMSIGGRLIPSHIYFSRKWVTKVPDLVTESQVAEEAAFIDSFPHREQIAQVFRLARLDYGRVDYGVKDGRVQVWEINTNPIIVRRRDVVHPLRIPSQAKSAEMIAKAFRDLARGIEKVSPSAEKAAAPRS